MKKKSRPCVLVVYCIDAEGPLYESLEATFERIHEHFGMRLEPNAETLAALQGGEIPSEWRAHMSGREAGLMSMIHPSRLQFSADWRTLNERVTRCFQDGIRLFLPDSKGNSLVYSWFAVDRIGMDDNPRRRALGFHQVYDFYHRKLKDNPDYDDELYWHYHPVPFTGEAHKCATSLSHNNFHFQVLARRLIDRGSFPVSFRPGCDVERTDLNLFLEQWIPFDYANMAGSLSDAERQQPNCAGVRFDDWRFAPTRWATYHPDIYEVQKSGVLSRYIARCRYVQGRIYQITQEQIDEAFLEARENDRALLAVMSHDTRDLPAETMKFLGMLRKLAMKYQDVVFSYCNARRGIQHYNGLNVDSKPQIDTHFDGHTLTLKTSPDIWGAQPFLAFKTLSNQYFHDNMNRMQEYTFSYIFDRLSIPAEALDSIGVACHNKDGNTSLCVMKVQAPEFDPKNVKVVFNH